MSEKAFKPEPLKDSSDRIKRTDPDKESRGLPFLFNREQTEALSKTMSVGFDEGPTVKPSGNVQAKAGPGQQPVTRQMPDLSKLKPTVPPKSPAQLKKEEQFRETWGMQHMSPEKQMQLKLKYNKEGLEADMARDHFNNYVKQQAKQLKRNKHEKNLLNNKANAFKRAMIQNKIAYGSPEYNTAVKQCFPDFDTELPAYKKDVGKNPVNNDPKLEHEADVMGKQAAEGKTVQKQEEERERQAKKEGSNPPSPSGSGTKTKLPEEVQSKMENSFGTSFSDVNIHPNDEGAKDMGALAYTQGKDVHFAPGQYSPGTQKGQELIGHELTHVEQQKAGRVQPTAQGKGMAVNDDPKLENEADEMGKKAAEGKVASPKITDENQVLRKKLANENEMTAEDEYSETDIESLEDDGIGDTLKASSKAIGKAGAKVVSKTLKKQIEEMFPVDTVIQLEGNVGITFGYPVGLKMNAITMFHRKDKDTLIIKKYIKGGAGLDTGTGFKIGLSRRGKTTAGINTGADASAMLASYSEVEYAIPFKKGNNSITALYASTMPVFADDAGIFTDEFRKKYAHKLIDKYTDTKIDVSKFMTKSKLALGVDLQGSAGGELGLSYGSGDGEENRNRGLGGMVKDTFMNKILSIFKLKALAHINEAAFLGVDIDVDERDKETQEVEKATGSVYIDLSALGSVSVPMLPSFNLGIATEGKLIYKYNRSGTPQLKQTGAELVLRSGDLSSYQGAAMEISTGLSEESVHQVKDEKNIKIAHIAEMLTNIKLKKRFELFPKVGIGRLEKLKEKQDTIKSTLDKHYGKAGASASLFLTLDIDFGKVVNGEGLIVINEILQNIINKLKIPTEKPFETSIKLLNHLAEVITGKRMLVNTSPYKELWLFLHQKNIITRAELAAYGEFGFAGGVSIAALEAKLKVNGSIESGGAIILDFLKIIHSIVEEGDLDFLKELFGDSSN